MEEEVKNELNDIILNKNNSSSSNKKIILAVATLGVILIVVVLLMNTLNSNSGDNLPKPVPLPTPQTIESEIYDDKEEPLFEEVEVIQEESMDNNLEQIAQKLKKESLAETNKIPVKKVEVKKVKVEAKKVEVKKVEKTNKVEVKKESSVGSYYVQVGSFSKYEPNKKFLKSITDKGYQYKFHKVGRLNKVLVGPFSNDKKARTALRAIRSSIEAGAFITKI